VTAGVGGMNPFDLSGETAIVTGASGGLGAHFARLLARHGAKVALAARRVDRTTALAEEIAAAGGRALPVACDVTIAASVEDAVAAAETELGPVTLLVNNSGIAIAKKVLDHDEADWDAVLDTNLKGAWLMSRAVASRLVAQGRPGRIVNIASIVGLRTIGQLPSYAASKAGLIHLTRALAMELARSGIAVNALAPGYIETDINREFLASPLGKKLEARIPLARFGVPEDLDGALLLLASTAGRYITGVVLPVDGGHLVNSL
jgi:NAD(P)-dependent dehydrogenase (short-subunit alcohol dehydrogenase family)